MAVSDVEFYELVKNDFDSDSEMIRRNAASRSYYSIYHQTKQAGFEGVYSDVGMHRSLIDTMTRDVLTKRAGFILNSVYALRIIADYKLDEPFTKSQAKTLEEVYQRYSKVLPSGSRESA